MNELTPEELEEIMRECEESGIPPPRTRFAALILKHRNAIEDAGIPLLTDEELEREIKERRGEPYPDDDD